MQIEYNCSVKFSCYFLEVCEGLVISEEEGRLFAHGATGSKLRITEAIAGLMVKQHITLPLKSRASESSESARHRIGA